MKLTETAKSPFAIRRRGQAPISESEFQTAIRRLGEALRAQKIILFGSYAYGTPTLDSDVDLLVIADTDSSPSERRRAVSALCLYPLPAQVLTKTPAEIDRALAVGDFFIREILTQGQVVYEAGLTMPVDPRKRRQALDLSFAVGGEVNEVTDPLRWVDRAEEDYATARWALRRKVPLTPTACFHIQQCVEKYMKASLVARGQGFPKVHGLSEIDAIARPLGIFVPLTAEQLALLTEYAVEPRYPGHEPTVEDARHALELARTVRRYVRRLLGLS